MLTFATVLSISMQLYVGRALMVGAEVDVSWQSPNVATE